MSDVMNNKAFKVLEGGIYGVRHARLHIVIDSVERNDEIIVFADGEKIESLLVWDPVYPRCVAQADLPDKAKKITVQLVRKSVTYEIYNKSNSFMIRLKNKIVDVIKRSLFKVKFLFVTSIRFVKWLHRYRGLTKIKLSDIPDYWKYFYGTVAEQSILFSEPMDKEGYLHWIKLYEKFESEKKLQIKPKFSILIPVYNISSELLLECVDSIANQTYKEFEICLSDDCSTSEETLRCLKELENREYIKVHYRKENGHISRATNDALKMATGDYVILMDNDDILSPHALYEVAKAINDNPELDFIYSDEDKLDLDGRRCEPHFKPDYSPDTILSCNYMSHLGILRTSIMKEIGGFTEGLEGSQDYDLYLRFLEKTSPNNVFHIRKILYHWRKVEGSTSMTIDNKGYAIEAGRQSVQNHLDRIGAKARVEVDTKTAYYRVHYEYDAEPSVSIVIPTKDLADITETCVKSIYEKTDYRNYEVIIVNNRSEKKETFDFFNKYLEKYDNFKVIEADMEFNYSKINNVAVEQSNADVIVLLNNDTEIISENWLKEMVGFAIQPHVGAVGAKLYYPDNTIQHAGVVMGVGGIANHAYVNHLNDSYGLYGRLRVPYNYSAITAACLVIERSKYLEVGMLNEKLKVAFNDVDFCLKLIKAGYYNVCIPEVELYHYESKSRGSDADKEKAKRFNSESEYMKEHWNSFIKNDPFYNPAFSKDAIFKLNRK